jgi:signal transduction histidine kinase
MPQHIATTGHILLVSSQLPSDSSLTQLLQSSGHSVLLASNADSALAFAGIRSPDLVLIDAPLPGLTGMDLLAALHKHPNTRHVPLIFLTPEHNPQRLLHAFDSGAVDYIHKPFAHEELLARVRVHMQLKLTRDRLEQVANERQQLVNLVAHDLKNPLTSVLFACEMLEQPNCKPERTPRYLQIINESTHEALGYIRGYLESQSPAASQPDTSITPSTHLGDTLRWLASRYELQLEANGVRLRVDDAHGNACVAIRREVLRQVGENLVSNALKYARAGGELEIFARAGTPGYWQLVAQDRGPGIPDNFQPLLFKPFQRLHAQDSASVASNGLGLALARQIIVSAGGRLWYEDREGGGARFTIELPEAGSPPANEYA